MISETQEVLKISLSGDWSMSGITERFPQLVQHFERLAGSDACGEYQAGSSGGVPEIDLADVTDFDACGCQLLAHFVRNLKNNGIEAQLTNISAAFRSKIQFLGFGRELNLPL